MIKNSPRILFDTWYGDHLTGNVSNLDEILSKKYNRFFLNLSKKSCLRGFFFFKVSKEFDILLSNLSNKGTFTLLILEAIFRKEEKRIILLEFIRPVPKNKILKKIWPLLAKHILSPILSRSLKKGQVLTVKEKEVYSNVFNLPEETFSFIPWPLHKNQTVGQKPIPDIGLNLPINLNRPYVMVSGRTNVDWDTIFEVAAASDWTLLAVCMSKYLDTLNKLNKNGRAVILNDISADEHARYLNGAAVYALCLEESNVSVGQIRLMNTIEQGVPVVATNVSGLEGYVIDGINALLVPPGDVNAFKLAVDKLINDSDLRTKLIKSAGEHQKNATFDCYIENIENFIIS